MDAGLPADAEKEVAYHLVGFSKGTLLLRYPQTQHKVALTQYQAHPANCADQCAVLLRRCRAESGKRTSPVSLAADRQAAAGAGLLLITLLLSHLLWSLQVLCEAAHCWDQAQQAPVNSTAACAGVPHVLQVCTHVPAYSLGGGTQTTHHCCKRLHASVMMYEVLLLSSM